MWILIGVIGLLKQMKISGFWSRTNDLQTTAKQSEAEFRHNLKWQKDDGLAHFIYAMHASLLVNLKAPNSINE